MASSDEEGEILLEYVIDYEFLDGRDQPVSFSRIQLCLTEDELDREVVVGMNSRVYLHGTSREGLSRFTKCKQVFCWKYNISSPKPELSVLCKKNHQGSTQSIWNHLARVFSSFDAQQCESDILDHIGLVKDAFKSDLDLQESEVSHNCTSSLPASPSRRRRCPSSPND